MWEKKNRKKKHERYCTVLSINNTTKQNTTTAYKFNKQKKEKNHISFFSHSFVTL